MINQKKEIGRLARDLYNKKITYEQFMNSLPEDEKIVDSEIFELIDLIEHEPRKGGLFGVSQKQHEDYLKHIFNLIDKLIKGN